jgi:general secretion pathway protein E
MGEGMRTLRLSGAIRVARGETTIEEVMRVAPQIDA